MTVGLRLRTSGLYSCCTRPHASAYEIHELSLSQSSTQCQGRRSGVRWPLARLGRCTRPTAPLPLMLPTHESDACQQRQLPIARALPPLPLAQLPSIRVLSALRLRLRLQQRYESCTVHSYCVVCTFPEGRREQSEVRTMCSYY